MFKLLGCRAVVSSLRIGRPQRAPLTSSQWTHWALSSSRLVVSPLPVTFTDSRSTLAATRGRFEISFHPSNAFAARRYLSNEKKPPLTPIQQSLLDYLGSSNDDTTPRNQLASLIESPWWKENITDNQNVLELQHVVVALRDFVAPNRYSPTDVQMLLERILELQETDGQTTSLLPQQLADTRTELGTVLFRMGQRDQALKHLQEALALRQEYARQQQEGTPEQETALMDLAQGHVHVAAVLNQTGQLADCYNAFDRALQLQQQVLGKNHAVVAATLNNMGAVLYQQGDFEKAIDYYQQSLDIHVEIHGEGHSDTAGSYHNLATALKHKGDPLGALEAYQKSLQIRTAVLGKEHPDTVASHYGLAQLLSEMGEFDGALEQYQVALEAQQSIYGKLHRITASTHNNIGAVLYQKGEYEKALEQYNEGLSILKAVTNPPAEPLEIASNLNNIGMAMAQREDYEGALSHHREALDMAIQYFGTKEHPSLAATIGSIGQVLQRQGSFDEALAEFRKAHDLLRKGLGPTNIDVASSHNNLGLVLAQQGKLDEALQEYQSAKNIFETVYNGASHPHTASCHYNMAIVLSQQGQTEQARTEYELAHKQWEDTLGPDHPQTMLAANAAKSG